MVSKKPKADRTYFALDESDGEVLAGPTTSLKVLIEELENLAEANNYEEGDFDDVVIATVTHSVEVIKAFRLDASPIEG